LLQTEDAARALRLAGAMWMFWLWQGGFAEGRRWLTEAMALGSGQYPIARAKALWGTGWLAYHHGDYWETAMFAEALSDLARGTGQPLDRRHGLTLQGMAQMAAARHREAVSAFEQALRICRQLDDSWLHATSLLNLGTAVMHAGDLERAEALLAEASRATRSWATTRTTPAQLATSRRASSLAVSREKQPSCCEPARCRGLTAVATGIWPRAWKSSHS
jgi:tetratricopeptide (TPR) repeat protein